MASWIVHTGKTENAKTVECRPDDSLKDLDRLGSDVETTVENILKPELATISCKRLNKKLSIENIKLT